MTLYWKIHYDVTLRAPWITPGDAAPGPSTDIVLARNQGKKFILPATLIKGNLRAASEVLVEEKVISSKDFHTLFGTPSATRSKGLPEHPWRVANEPEHGGLIFEDLVTEQVADDENARTQRVEIDTEMGAAREGHLLFVECPFPFGTPVTFSGKVILWGHCGVDAADAVKLLNNALGRVFAIGGMKSVGFGEVTGFEVGDPVPVVAAKPSAPSLSLAMEYKILSPFIVDTERHSGNLSVGSQIVSGSTIKAMLSRGCKAAGIDAQNYLSALNISHASPNGAKPLPLSLSICGDASSKRVFCNLDGKMRKGFHKFACDWKKTERDLFDSLEGNWNTQNLSLSGRSRTAIDSKTLGSLFEKTDEESEGVGQLFSQVAVVPGDTIWHGKINAPDDGKLGELLGLLNVGLPGLGKTGAVIEGSAKSFSQPRAVPDGNLNLTLTSNACLFKPQDASDTDIEELYRNYFKSIGFELKNFFASQVLKGGYLALRYPAQTGKYIPWILTEAGSVFHVAPIGNSENSPDIENILKNGLPPAQGLSSNWQEFPFLRENGFGHVEHNILDHAQFAKGVAL